MLSDQVTLGLIKVHEDRVELSSNRFATTNIGEKIPGEMCYTINEIYKIRPQKDYKYKGNGQ
jgi:hypothetical protein